jgi:serine/threonine-protein kinase HipA
VSDQLVVIVGAAVAGRITRTAGRLDLVYDEAYRRDPSATALSVSLPLESARHDDAALAPWLAGLLPDNNDVLRRWSRMFQVSAAPFSLLSTPIGEECAGAARFLRPDRVDAALTGQGAVRWISDSDVAQRLRDLRADTTAWLGTEFAGRFSLAGAQAKTALLWDEPNQRWGVPDGAAATSHILKPAIAGLDDHDLNEHLCLRTAALVGLICAPTQLLRFADQSAVVSARYDRVDTGGEWLTRVHQEDMCQALGMRPEDKYQNEGGPGSRDVVALLRRVLPADRVDIDVWRLFDAATFNWIIAGTDAHAKNYSLLLSGRQVRLAPLYDIASALPYPKVHIRKLRLAMKFAGSYLLDSYPPSIWPKIAAEFSLPVGLVRDRARALLDATPDALADVARAADVRQLASTLPTRLTDAVAGRVASIRRSLHG